MASVWRFPFGASRALLRRIAGRAAANIAAQTAVNPQATTAQAGYAVARNTTGLDGTTTPTIQAAFISSGEQFFAPTVTNLNTVQAPLISSGEQVFGATVTVPSNVTLVAPVVASTAGFPDSTKPYQGAILPLKLGVMPHISRGKPIYGTGNYSKMNDGGYGYDTVTPGAWTATAGDWVAINVGSGPSQVLVALSNDLSAIGSGTYLTSSFAAYRLQVSNDSTNGSDGTWTTVVTETTNPAMNREHKFSFTGYSWVKLICDTISGGQLDELDIWDASSGTDNTFAFLGDSLSVRGTQRYTFFGGGVQPSFQENTNTNTGRYPLQLSAGVSGQSAAGWASNIASVLALYPDVKYWAIGIGMNDGATMPGAISTWRTNMQTVIDAILADGRIPILARVSWTGSATYGGGDFNTCGLAYLNENGVEWLFQQYGASLRRGPDLYKLFYDNRVAYAVETDPHWNDDGTIAWNAAWANSLGTDTSRTLVAPFISSGTQLYAPTVIKDALAPPRIESTEQIFTPVIPWVGNAVRIDASADSMHLATLPGSSPWTYVGWAKINTDRNTYSGLFSVESAGAAQYIELITEADGTTLSLFDHVSGNIATVGAMTVGTWYRTALVVNGTSFTAYFGPEGTSSLSSTSGTCATIGTVAYSGVGATQLYGSEWFDGSLAGFRVWNAALTAAEIEREFKSYTPVRSSNLLGAWFPKDVSAATALTAISGSNLVANGASSYTVVAGPVIAQALDTAFISSGSQVFAAAEVILSAGSTLQPPLIASGEQTFGPTLTNLSTVAAPLISSGEQVFGPTLVSTVVAPRIESTVQTFAPALTQSIVAPRIESGVQFFGPTLVSTIVAPFISSGSQVFAGGVTATLSASRIESTEQFFGPTLTNLSTVVAPFIPSGEQTFGPTLVSTVVAPRIESTEQVFAATLTQSVAPPRIDSTAQVFGPTLTNLNTVVAPLISSGSQVFAATVGQFTALAPPRIDSTEQVFGSTLSNLNTIQAPLISSGEQVFGATVGQFTSLTAPRIESTEQFFGATLTSSLALAAPQIGSTAQVHSPALSALLSTSRIESTAQTFGPALTSSLALAPSLLGPTATTFAPSVIAGATNLQPPQIGSAAQVYSPTLSSSYTVQTPVIGPDSTVNNPALAHLATLVAPRIDSTAQLFGSSIVASLAAPFVSGASQTYSPTVTSLAIIQPPTIPSAEQIFAAGLASDNTIATPVWIAGTQIFEPSVVAVVAPPRIDSGSQTFSPNLVLGAGWPEPTQTIPLIRALELPLPTTVTRIVGIHQSDIIIRSAIEAGLADIRANTWLLDYVFASLPQDSLTWKEYGEKSVQEVKKWFVSTHIPVTLGPRMDESKFPQINIELLESSEVVPEAIIGDVNYDPHETNDTSWPALTPPFTPVSYTPSTGLVVLGAAPEAWVGKGMFIIDRTGKAFEIIEGVSDKSFKIDPGSVGDFRQCVLKGHRPNWIVDVESSSFKETYRVGIHTTDPVHLTWLHAIMQFALLRYKQVLLEARGFERSTIASSQVARDQSYETENVFVRYITVSGYVRQFWPKTVAPVIDGVELDALSVSGQDADVSIAKVDDPVEQLWVGNLDTIRTRR